MNEKERMSEKESELAEENEFFAVVNDDSAGKRIVVFLAVRLEMTRSAIQKLADSSLIRINQRIAPKSCKLSSGDMISVILPAPEPTDVCAENIPIDIIYEDDDILVVNKAKGMVVHPAPGNYRGTLVNALLYHCKDSLSGIGGVIRPGIVHRIDKDTSGLLMVAKNDKAHVDLASQIAEHSFLREYEAIALGCIKEDEKDVEEPIGRHPVNRKKMAVVSGGRYAMTHIRVIERFSGFTRVRCRLETGRTHQIRVHMSSMGHPLMCDELYGAGRTDFEKKNASLLNGQCLHARTLGFVHPISKRDMCFESELPEYFEKTLEKLRRRG